jgi:hypothetical protein
VCGVSIERGVLFCVICVLCLIIVPLTPGRNPFAVKINNNNKMFLELTFLIFICELVLHRPYYFFK